MAVKSKNSVEINMGPRILQQLIHSTFSTSEATWTSLRNQITSAYAEGLHEDFNFHIIREYNRKISRLGISTSLFIIPYNAGFSFIGVTPNSISVPSTETSDLFSSEPLELFSSDGHGLFYQTTADDYYLVSSDGYYLFSSEGTPLIAYNTL